MPQFDPTTFASQLFWLAVTFVLLFIVVSRFAIPRLGEVLEQRQKLIADDLDRAHQLKAETEDAIRSYEKALAEARAKAHDVLRAAQDEMSKAADERNKAVSAALAEQIKQGETRIGKARDEALASVRDIAGGAAAAAVSRLAGLSPDDATIQAAVSGVMKESA